MATTKPLPKKKDYNSDSIETQRFPDNVRASPAMYIGGTDAHGMFVVLRELLDNAVDEYLAGRNTFVAVKVDADGSYWVQDGGAGIPQGVKKFTVSVNGKAVASSMPTMQAVFGELHTSGKFKSEAYAVSIGCFTGDTKIRLLDGHTVSMERLYGRWTTNQNPIDVMTFDKKSQKLIPSKISHVQLTKKTRDLVRLEFDDGNSVRCTPEHKFFVRRGGSIVPVQAQNLTPEDSLVASYYKDYCYKRGDGYLSQSCEGLFKGIHRIVAEHMAYVPEGWHVHHRTGVTTDNRPSNLEILSHATHKSQHVGEFSVAARRKIMEEQAELRASNSRAFTVQNYDEDFLQEAWETKAIKIATRAIAKFGKLTKSTYDQVRLHSDMRFDKAISYVGSREQLQRLASDRHAQLVATKDSSLKALRELEQICETHKSVSATSKERSWQGQVILWSRALLSCEDPRSASPEEFNVRNGSAVFGRFALLRKYTSLKRLKAHVLDGAPLVLFDDQSNEAQTRRLMSAEYKMRAPQATLKVVNGFLNVCKRLPKLDEETYMAMKGASNPSWVWALFLFREVYGLKGFDPYAFGPEEMFILQEVITHHNHRVSKITRLRLANAVPVYDLTVDGTHTFFIEPGVLVANSHGVGSKGTNATAEFFEVKTCFNGKWFAVAFKKGLLTSPVAECKAPKSPFSGKPLAKGTLIHYKPDATIFKVKTFPPAMLQEWAELQAYLNPGFRIIADVKGKKKQYMKEGGPKDYIADQLVVLKSEAEPDIFWFKNELATVAVAFSNVDGFQVRGFTNGLGNSQGGTHVEAVAGALFNALVTYKASKQDFKEADFKDGLLGIINANLHKAAFSSQDKAKLTDERMGKEFEAVLTEEAKKFFAKNKALAKRLCDRASKVSELKSKFKASKAVATALNTVKRQGLPPNYAPAHRSVPIDQRVLYIVEGDSACFVGETEVRLADGSVRSFAELVLDFEKGVDTKGLAFDTTNQCFVEVLLGHPRVTKMVTELIELITDTGELIKCTVDHRFLLEDGKYKEAQHLTEHDVIREYQLP